MAVGAGKRATFLGGWEPTDLFGITQRKLSVSVSVELGSKFAEGFPDE